MSLLAKVRIAIIFAITINFNVQAQQSVTVVNTIEGPHKVTLSWTKSTPSANIRYNIYRGTSSTSLQLVDSNIVDTVYTATSLVGNRVYYYAIKAKNIVLNTTSGLSNVVSVKPTNIWYVSTTGLNTNMGNSNTPLRSIQSAVNFAVDGDTILLKNGNYIENVEIYRKNVAVIGINGPDYVSVTALDPAVAVFNLRSNWDINDIAHCYIVGIKVQGCSNVFRVTERMLASIVNCYFNNNAFVFSSYYGYYNVQNCVFASNNTVANNDVGDSDPKNTFYHCTITNTTDYITNSNPSITNSFYNSIIYNNRTNSTVTTDFNGKVTLNNVIFDGSDVVVSASNVINQNPLFADSKYIQLLNNSPAIGAGSLTYVLNNDYFNSARPFPANSNPDLGAYESIYSYTSPVLVGLVGGNQKIRINWTANNSAGVTKYRILRSNTTIPNNATTGVLVDTLSLTTNSYLDSGLTNLTKYYYRIQAGNNTGLWSGLSNELSVRPNIAPSVPVLISANNGPRKARLIWRKATSANSSIRYNLYRGLSANTTQAVKLGISDTSFIDTGLTAGVKYYYQLRAVDTAGVQSAFSNTLFVTPNRILYVSNLGDSLNIGNEQYPLKTIAHAMHLALLGDTVIALPGIYFENLVMSNSVSIGSKYLINKDTTYIKNTIIDGSTYSGNSALLFSNDHYSSYQISGLTIQNSTTYAIIATNYRNAKVIACVFKNNGNTNNWGTINLTGNILVDSCYFTQNKGRFLVTLAGNASAGFCKVTRSVFENNGIPSDSANWFERSIFFIEQRGIISNNVIYNNYLSAIMTGGNGGFDSIFVINNTIYKNKAIALYFSNWGGGSFVNYYNNIIENNKTNVYYYNFGGYSKVIFRNNYINPYQSNTANKLLYNISFYNNDTTATNNYLLKDSNYKKITSSASIINKGTSLFAPTIDLNGNVRPNPAGSNPDLGAYESPYKYSSPLLTELLGGNQNITIKWSKSTNVGVTKYRIFRSLSPIPDNTTSGIIVDTLQSNTLTYVDQALTNLSRYYYRIQVGDNLGVWSPLSNELSSRPNVPPASPILSSAIAGPKKVLLIWNKSTSANSSIKYNLYRGTTLNNIQLVKSQLTDTTITDTGLVVGQQYFYHVKAVDTIGVLSAASNVLSATPNNKIYDLVLSTNRACAGDVISLKYYSDSTFVTGNTLQFQLSDSSGSFLTPQILSTITTVAGNGTLQGTLHNSLLSSNHYKVRVVSSTPNFISSLTSEYLGVMGDRTATLTSSTVCAPLSIIAGTNTKAATIYSWYKDGNLIASKIPGYKSNGMPVAGYGQNNFNANLNVPNDIFVSDNGFVYIADGYNHRVVRINPNYTSMTVVAGGNGSGSALNQLNNPASLFVDKDDNIYIADASNNRIMKWSKSATTGVVVAGSATGLTGTANNRLNSPQGVFVDASGNVFIGDMYNHRVMKWAPNATTGVKVAGTGVAGNGATGLNEPMKVFLDVNGALYVTDKNNGRVQKFTLGNLNGTTVAGGNGWGQDLNQFTNAFGLYVDVNGNVFVSDHNNNRVLRFANGKSYADIVAGGRGAGTALDQTYNPNGIFVDKYGKLYVVENAINSVKVFEPIQSNADTLNVNTAGQYTVKVKDYALGCSAVTSSPLNINRPIAKITSSKGNIICANDTTILSTPIGIRYSYVWQKNGINISGASSNSLSVSTVGGYRVIVSDSTSCRDTSSVFNIYANPVINLTANGLCVGNELIATSTDTFPNVITWYKDGVAFKTKLPQFQTEGTVVAGTGGNFSLNLSAPDGFCIDRLGNYYIADQDNNRVVKVFADQSGFEIVAGGNGYGNALNQLYAPASIFVDDNFSLYIADRNNNRIVKWDKNATAGVVIAGSATGTAGNALNRLNNPNGVYVDASGTIFIADRDNHRIVKWLKNATTGTLVAGTGVAGNGPTGLNNPWVVFVDNFGNVYVGDKENQRVQMFPPNSSNGITVAGGNGWGTLTNQISNPFALYVDILGNIYVSDHNNSRVLRFPKGSSNGEVVAGGNGDGLLYNQTRYPNGIAIGLDGKLYVTERGNNRVMAFDVIKSNNDTLKATLQGNYQVTYQNYLFGCSTTSLTKQIKKPVVNLVSSLGNNLCQGDTSTLSTPLDTNYTYRWQKDNLNISGAITNIFKASQIGSYRVIVTDNNSCTDTSSTVTISPLPTATIASSSTCLGSSLTSNSPKTSLSIISWYKDNQLIKRTKPNYNIYGSTFGTASSLNAPDGFFIDKAGNYYISDQENHRVVKVAANKSTYQIVAGGNGYGSALNQLYGPASIFVDDDYNLFIADRTNNRIVKWAPGATTGVVVAGSTSSLAGNALNRLNNPNGIFVDKAGTLFIADKDNHRIVKWLKNATTGILVAGNGNPGGGSTGLNSPWVIWVDAAGNIYVGDKDNQRVQMFPPNSNIGQTVAGGIGWGTTPSHITNPFGLFVDDFGSIFVSDHNNNRVLRFMKGSLNGEVVAGGNGQGALSNQTSTPNGIFVDPKGILYVVERSNNRVNTFNPIIINRDTITASSRGNYYVKYTDYETRCSGISALISPIPKIFTKDTIRVFGADTTLFADTTTYQTFLWSNGSTANKIKVSQTGFYSLNAKINATNCSREDKIFVYFGSAKIANAISTICSDDSIIIRANTNKLGAKTQLAIDSAFVYGNGTLDFYKNDSVNMYSWSSGSPGYVVLGKTNAKYGEISANVVSPNASIKASVVMAMQKEYPANQPTYYAGSAALVFSIYTNGASIENSLPNSPYSPTILKSISIPNLLTSVKHNISMKHTYDDTLRCYLDGVEIMKLSTLSLNVRGGKFALRGDNTSYVFSKINYQKYDAKIRWNTGDTTFAIKKAPLVTTGYSFVLSDNNYKFKDSATVNVLQSPIALIQPADSTFCSGDSLLLAANTGTGLTYQWKLNGNNIAGATNANYFAKSAGNYTVQVKSANNCIKTSSTKYLGINALPISSITSSKTSFCIGDSVNLTGNTGTGLTYQWKLNGTNIVGATNANYYAKQSGQYTLEVTNAKGCKKLSLAKTMSAIDFPNATVTAQSPITFCQGGTVTLSAPTGTALTYVWKKNNINISGATTATYIANASGSYTVTITNSTGCVITSQPTVVTVNTLPIASITTFGATTTCQGDSIKLKSNVENGFTYQWKRNLVNIPNAIDSIFYAKQSGTYSVAITNVNGCLKESTAKNVTINSLPNVSLNAFNAVCLLSAPVQLSGGTPTGGVYSGAAVTNGFFNPSTAGVGLHNIKYTYTDANGCVNSSTRSIEVKQMPINRINKNGPIVFCKGSAVGLSVAMEPGKTFTWFKDGVQISNIGNSINVSNAGNYHAVVTANGCTINTDTVLITVQPLPVVSISPTGPTTICSGFNTGVKASGDQNLNYQWIKDNVLVSAAIDSNLVINASGNYRVIATNQNGCIDTSNTIVVNVLSYPIAIATANSNTTFCIGDSVKINANTGQNLSYQWFKNSTIIAGATDSFYYAKLDGAYTVSVTLSNLCSTLSNAINITTNPLPISNITSLSGVDFCSGDTLELQGNIATNVTYQWFLNNNLLLSETNRKIKATQQGNYMLRVRDINGCDKFSDNFPIQYYNPPYSQELICAISVDSLTGKNVIVWEKTPGVRTEKFNMYREGAVTGQYDLIGSVNYNQMSTFVDNTANPLSQSYRYKIAVVDSCGFESAKSPLHRTIHLSSNIGVNGEINLAWAPYEGVNYLTHRILRSLNGAPYQTIASVSGTTFSYTDLVPPAGPKYYRIEIDVPGGCSPTAMVQGFSRILSNPVAISTNGITNENYQASLIKLYPNPTNGIVNVVGIINNNEVKVEIYDGIGKLLKIEKLTNDGSIDISEFTPGVYTFKIEDRVQKIVKM